MFSILSILLTPANNWRLLVGAFTVDVLIMFVSYDLMREEYRKYPAFLLFLAIVFQLVNLVRLAQIDEDKRYENQ